MGLTFNMRVFQPIPFTQGATVVLTPTASHHVLTVMRAKINDPLTLFNGEGGEYQGYITNIAKKKVSVQITSFEPRNTESTLELYLAQGISRGEKMDFTIQKAVELGIKKIIPLFTERSSVKLDQERAAKRLAHWQSIAIGAAEQSGRNCIPEIVRPLPLAEALPTMTADWRFILNPEAKQAVATQPIEKNKRILLLIGPEGGFSPHEVQTAAQCNFLPLSLGPRILRTETAAVVAIALFQSYFGDLH